MNIAIIKYGMGNVASVQKALNKLGYHNVVTDNHKVIKQSDMIILPGVGSFKKGMENLSKTGLVDLLTDLVIVKKKPFLGICLGMQLLATFGNEPSKYKGLGWIEGEVLKIETKQKIRIPHLGWNDVSNTSNMTSFYGEFSGKDFYFIHSYKFIPKYKKDIVLNVEYGDSIAAALQKGNIYATQFHPEKSQEVGMRLLKKIIEKYA